MMALIHLQRSYNFMQLFLLVSMLLFRRRSHGEFPAINLHTIEIASLLPVFSCTREQQYYYPSDSKKLEIVAVNDPCSSTTTKLVSDTQILGQDQSRVELIQGLIKSNQFKGSKANIPAQWGVPQITGNYFVNVGLGTPTKKISLIFDTVSSLSWTQCEPCYLGCYPQNDIIFDPRASTSYSNISCTSHECDQIVNSTYVEPTTCSPTSTCVYRVEYSDGSITIGFLSKDKLTLTPKEVFPGFMFGCSQYSEGLFRNVSGLLGLSRDNLSFVFQTAEKYGKVFSYCLPSTTNFTGFLRFGKDATHRHMNFTYLHTNPDYVRSLYFVKIISISVGGCKLPINCQSIFEKAGGTVMDLGKMITHLPPDAYTALRDEFRKYMSKYGKVQSYSMFDTCYLTENYNNITIPTMSFTFEGNVKVKLNPSGIIYTVNSSLTCLAFAANEDPTDVAIFGNTQQKTLEVVYDVAKERIGFRPGACP